jgi:hypothetical protein
MDEDEDETKPGKPVEKLGVDDPLNRALGAIQLSINELASTCWTFVEEFMGKIYRAGTSGVLDLKMTTVQDKLIVRRAFRKPGEPPPRGNFWSIPMTREVLAEYFERIKPAPPEPTPTPIDIDASTAAPEPTTFSPADLLRQRQRETAALVHNLKRTKDEIGGAGIAADFVMIDAALAALEDALVITTAALEARGTLQ